MILGSHNSQFPFYPKVNPLANVRSSKAKACNLAEFEDETPETLRHSFAIGTHEIGISELTIAGLLGYQLYSVSSRYAHHFHFIGLVRRTEILSWF